MEINASIFQNKIASLECTTTQGIIILEHFPQAKDSPPMIIVREEQVDKNVPWYFFDGASQNNGLACGGGLVLFLSDSHFFKLNMGLGFDSNNYAELMALKLLILFAREKGVISLRIFGDSLNVVNWTRKLQRCHNIILAPLIEEIDKILNSFDSFSIHHVYRE